MEKTCRMEWFVCLSHDGGLIFVTSSVRVAIEVMDWRVSSLVLVLSIKHVFELPDFGTVAASEVNGVSRIRETP